MYQDNSKRKGGTKLSTKEERLYNNWRSKLPLPLQYEGNYDLRGLWKSNPGAVPAPNMHFPDTYKLPNHPTFSNESIYFNPANRDNAGYWQETDTSFNYIPYNPAVKDTVIEKKMPDGGTVKKKGPIGYLNSYYNSPMFRQRAGKDADKLVGIANSQAAAYSPYVLRTDSTDFGSSSADPVFMRLAGIPGNHNLVISLPQAKEIGAHPYEDILPHEYSHWTRGDLTNEEAAKFANSNKDKRAARFMRDYLSVGSHGSPYQQWLGDVAPDEHDIFPNENYSDLNTLRYLMYRQGIYDSGTRQMTTEDLEKAKKDPWIKKQFGFRRLLNTFKDEDIIRLNNEVASNNMTNSGMADSGTSIKGNNMNRMYSNGGSITPLSNNPTSQGIFRFNGPSHERGGIPIAYNGSSVEVEGDETGYIDKGGDLNIFGNMYVPGTRKKFKSLSKDIAAVEKKAGNNLRRSSALMNTVNDFDDPMERLRANSASIMGKSAMAQQSRATSAKENLSTLQNSMLNYADNIGMSPKRLFGKAARGYSLPGDPYPRQRPLSKEEQAVADNRILSPLVPDYLQQEVPVDIPYDRLGYDLEPIQSIRRDRTPDTPKLGNAIPSIQQQRKTHLSFDPVSTPVYNSPLSLGQVMPELYTLATNRQEFVPSQHFTPQLLQPTRVSFQDRLNQNNSTFRAIANSSNPAAMAQIAAQKYNADQQVLGDEFRANQSVQDQVTNRNIEMINQANLQNIGFARENAELRAQNAAATRATTRAAITSIAGKNLQMQQYNRGLTLYNQMTPHYRYNSETGQWDFASQGPVDINVGGLSTNSTPSYANLYGESRVTDYARDSKGRLLRRSEQRAPGLLRIIKRK